MLDDRAQTELLATFQVELAEHSQALTRAFLALEKEPEPVERRRLLAAAFRSAHNLKGAGRAVALSDVEMLAHRMEGVLGAASRAEVELSPALFDLLYAAVDTLSAAASADAATGASQEWLDTLGARLEAAQTGDIQPLTTIDPPPAIEPRPTPAPLAVLDEKQSSAAPPPRPSLAGADRASLVTDIGETIRLPAARLDALLEQLGELVIPRLELRHGLTELVTLRIEAEAWQREWRRLRPRLRQLEHEGALGNLRPLVRFLERNETNLTTLAPRLNAVHARLAGPTADLGVLTDDLQTHVMRFRMLPFGHLSGNLERTVRDLTRSLGKEARLVLIGSDTEVDRRALEDMKDPLLHLLRNALDHGLEVPAERQRLGKPAIGSVVVGATQRGNTTVIEVEDDGAGISVAAVRRVAAERGLATDADLAVMHDRDVLRLIFLPGFSTRGDVTEVSGRGVGLDVVARNVERLGGRVDVESHPDAWTRFTVTLPLTLATTRALLVEAGDALYALPTAAVEQVLRPKQLGSIGGRPMLEYDGTAIPVVALSSLFGGGGSASKTPATSTTATPTLVLVGTGQQRVALLIDRVVGEQEIVVKPLPYPLMRVRHIAGATILGSGRIVPILNVPDLLRGAARSVPMLVAPPVAEPVRVRQRILVADDSLTTRTMERYILEAAGYEVELAGDGAEALALLQERGCDVLVSDVEMPGLDGIQLTERVRAEPGLRDLPVILVTSLDSATDRERGLQAGADAYIVKTSFDQDQLLRTIREIAS
jgi:two-component system chemotaxis sensor kinase CheA